MLQTIRTWKANWIGHILHRNCLLKHIFEGKIDGRNEVMGRRWRCKQLLDDLKENTGHYKLKQKELGRTLWRTGFGPVASHKRRNDYYYYLECTPCYLHMGTSHKMCSFGTTMWPHWSVIYQQQVLWISNYKKCTCGITTVRNFSFTWLSEEPNHLEIRHTRY